MSINSVLPENMLDVFPVQFFSQRELSNAERLRPLRAGTEGIFFRNNFGGLRPERREAGTGRAATTATTGHRAIDIMAPRGVPVFATKTGNVPTNWWVYNPEEGRLQERTCRGTVTADSDGDGGNYLVILDDAGKYHYYAHLNAPSVIPSVGLRVAAGDLIGYVGNTGRSALGTPPHLHYQVTTRGTPGDRSGPSIFWSPYRELVRLGETIGGRLAGRFGITFDDFLAVAESQSTSGVIHPWHVGFPMAGWDRHPLPQGLVDPWSAGAG